MSNIFNRARKVYILAGLFLSLLLSSCHHEQPEALQIVISKGAPEEYYGNYGKWLKNADSSVVWRDLYHCTFDSAIYYLSQSHALLLTGGPDVHPYWYGNEADTGKCGSFDTYRDSLEMALIDNAMAMNLPIFGICRGMQILNVFLEGSLYADIPTDYSPYADSLTKHRCNGDYNCYHTVYITEGSLLNKICGIETGIANSNHHQGINKLSARLKIVARTPDNFPEAAEYILNGDSLFIMGVQWHPERLDEGNVLSLPLANEFVRQARLYQQKNDD